MVLFWAAEAVGVRGLFPRVYRPGVRIDKPKTVVTNKKPGTTKRAWVLGLVICFLDKAKIILFSFELGLIVLFFVSAIFVFL